MHVSYATAHHRLPQTVLAGKLTGMPEIVTVRHPIAKPANTDHPEIYTPFAH
jgi:hypothetical protein